MQFCKVKIDNNNWSVTPNTVDVNILSAELLLDPMEYLQFIPDNKKWDELTCNGYTTYNTYHYININHNFYNNAVMNHISTKVKHFLREHKLNKILK
jgi:hypothetical protein